MPKEKLLVILNKKDLGILHGESELREQLGVNEIASVSALSGEGIEELRRLIYEKAIAADAGRLSRERIAVNERQASFLKEAVDALRRLEALCERKGSPELMSLEIRSAAEALGAITGRCITEDLLEVVFSKFCVGK